MPRKTTPRLGEVLDQYLAIRASHCAPDTIMNDRSVLRRFVGGMGNPQCHNLKATQVENWFAIEASRQQPTSYNKVRSRVAQLIAFLNRRGWLDEDVMAEVRPRRVVRKQRLQLSPAQLVQMIEETANPRDRGMLATSANTGLRAGDLSSLRVQDIDLDQGYLRVSIQKTGDADLLPITTDLAKELRTWLSWYTGRLAIIGQPIPSDGYLFPALGHCNVRRKGRIEQYGDPRPYQRLRHEARVVQRALSRIGVQTTAHEGFHTLRRSVGRAVFEQAASEGHDAALRLTAALLGHKSTMTTELYLGIAHDRVKRDQLLRGRSFLQPQQTPNVRKLNGYGT